MLKQQRMNGQRKTKACHSNKTLHLLQMEDTMSKKCSEYKRNLFPKLPSLEVRVGNDYTKKQQKRICNLLEPVKSEYSAKLEMNTPSSISPRPRTFNDAGYTEYGLKFTGQLSGRLKAGSFKHRGKLNRNKNNRNKPAVVRRRGVCPKQSATLEEKTEKKQKSQNYAYKVNQRIVVSKMVPRHIRFTNKNFVCKFSGINKTVFDTLRELKAGTTSVEDIPKLFVFRRNGKHYTINNKRLWVFKSLSTHYRKVYGKDMYIPVLYCEKVNLIKVSRTLGAHPAIISRKKRKEKKTYPKGIIQRLYIRSKKNQRRNDVLNREPRMKKAEIQRYKVGDDDFTLFSVKERKELLTETQSVKKCRQKSAVLTRCSKKFGAYKRLPTLGDFIEKFIGNELSRLRRENDFFLGEIRAEVNENGKHISEENAAVSLEKCRKKI